MPIGIDKLLCSTVTDTATMQWNWPSALVMLRLEGQGNGDFGDADTLHALLDLMAWIEAREGLKERVIGDIEAEATKWLLVRERSEDQNDDRTVEEDRDPSKAVDRNKKDEIHLTGTAANGITLRAVTDDSDEEFHTAEEDNTQDCDKDNLQYSDEDNAEYSDADFRTATEEFDTDTDDEASDENQNETGEDKASDENRNDNADVKTDSSDSNTSTIATPSYYPWRVIEPFPTLLSMTITLCTELRSRILKDPKDNIFDGVNYRPDGCHYIYYCAIVDNIFGLFGALCYMYYMCCPQCMVLEGAEWHDDKLKGLGEATVPSNKRTWDGQRTVRESDGNNLHRWLTDQNMLCAKHKGRVMVPREFKGVALTKRIGRTLFDKRDTERLLCLKDGEHMQYALYYMLFLGPWSHAKCGHCVLFLDAFCQMILDDLFPSESKLCELRDTCVTLSDAIQKLIHPRVIMPVCALRALDYRDMLRADAYRHYVRWLQENITELMDSLQEMTDDVSTWNTGALITASSYGPFPWGFSFGIRWEDEKDNIGDALVAPLKAVIEAIDKLKDAMDKVQEEMDKKQQGINKLQQ